MLYLLVFFIGFALSTKGTAGHFQDSRVNRVLELVLKTLSVPEHPLTQKIHSEDADSSEDDSHYGSLNSHEILNLIQQASETRSKNKRHHYDEINKYNFRDDLNHYSGNNILKELLSNAHSSKSNSQKRNKQRLIPNKLLGTSSEIENEVKQEAVGNLDDYSKIYIILNPQAIEKSRSINSINDLLSKFLSVSSQKDWQRERQTQEVYKGFPVKKGISLRRARRDSREMFAPKDSDDDYKQKRNRNDYAGGGGGRTAIPYIRHRGDIYEKDN